MFKLLTTSTLFIFWSLTIVAQSNTKNSVDSLGIFKWLSKSFSFNKPNAGFVSLLEGNEYFNKNFIKIITIIGFGNTTACIIGAYPKSKDSLTLKEQKEYYKQTRMSIRSIPFHVNMMDVLNQSRE